MHPYIRCYCYLHIKKNLDTILHIYVLAALSFSTDPQKEGVGRGSLSYASCVVINPQRAYLSLSCFIKDILSSSVIIFLGLYWWYILSSLPFGVVSGNQIRNRVFLTFISWKDVTPTTNPSWVRRPAAGSIKSLELGGRSERPTALVERDNNQSVL